MCIEVLREGKEPRAQVNILRASVSRARAYTHIYLYICTDARLSSYLLPSHPPRSLRLIPALYIYYIPLGRAHFSVRCAWCAGLCMHTPIYIVIYIRYTYNMQRPRGDSLARRAREREEGSSLCSAKLMYNIYVCARGTDRYSAPGAQCIARILYIYSCI